MEGGGGDGIISPVIITNLHVAGYLPSPWHLVTIRPWQVTALTMSSDALGHGHWGYLVRQLIWLMICVQCSKQFHPCGDQSQDFPARNIDWDCLSYNKLSLWLVTVHLLTLAPAPTWERGGWGSIGTCLNYWEMMMMWHNTWPLTTSHSSPETRGQNVGETRLINLAHTSALATRLTLHVSFHPNCLKIPPVNIIVID